MATYTSNLRLKKPTVSESQNIDDLNNNMELIDAFAGRFGTVPEIRVFTRSTAIDHVFTVPNSSYHFLVITSSNSARQAVVIMRCVSGTVSVSEVYKASMVSFDTSESNQLTIGFGSGLAARVLDIVIAGSAMSIPA